MHGTAGGDLHQPLPLVFIKVTCETDLASDLVEHRVLGLAILTVP